MKLIGLVRKQFSGPHRQFAVVFAVAMVGVGFLAAWATPVVVQDPTRAFDDAVGETITQKAKINVPVQVGPRATDTVFARDGLDASYYYPLYILSHLPLNIPEDNLVTLHSSKFYDVDGWLAVAAVRTPQVWEWKTTFNGPSVTNLPAFTTDRNTLATALRTKEEVSDSSTRYTVSTSDALQGAAAIAVTTVPLTGSLLAGIDDANAGPVMVDSLCFDLKTVTAPEACNSITVLWVKPRKGVTIRAY